MPDPKKNVAYTFDIGLVDQANRPQFKSNPTLASGDFKHSGDGGALANLGTLPVVDPASGKIVKVVLSQAEMNYDRVAIVGSDAAGAEWDDVLIYIDTTAVTVDDLVRSTTPANTLDVSAGGEAGVDWANVGGKTTSNALTGTTIATTQQVDVNTIKTQTVTCAAGVTVGAFVGNATAALGVDASGRVDVGKWLGTAASTPTVAGVPNVNVKTWNDLATVALPLVPTTAGRTLDVSAGGEAGVDWANVGSPTTSVGLSGTTISTSQQITSVSGAVGSVTGNVGGNVTGSVGTIGVNGIAAGSFSADSITSSALATSAVNEIQSGLSTLTAADIRSAVGLAGANLDTQLASIKTDTGTTLPGTLVTIASYIDTEVTAIKTKTDQLTFTTANQVDARTRTLDDGLIDDDTLATDLDTYQAKVWLFDDDSGTTDRYVVQWFKNGAPVTSGITSPVLQVFKAADGSDLVASTALTEIASTGAYRYDATGSERIASGAAYVAHTAATIDGSSRTWRQPVGRDSA